MGVREPTADTPVLSDKEAKSRSVRSSGKARQSLHAGLLRIGRTGAITRLLQGGRRQRELPRGGQQRCGQGARDSARVTPAGQSGEEGPFLPGLGAC